MIFDAFFFFLCRFDSRTDAFFSGTPFYKIFSCLTLARTRSDVRRGKSAFVGANLRPVRFEGRAADSRRLLSSRRYTLHEQSVRCAGTGSVQ